MPWRVAVYYWESGDPRVLPLMNALAAFFLKEKQVCAWPCARARGPGQSSSSLPVLISLPVTWIEAIGFPWHGEAFPTLMRSSEQRRRKSML